MFFGRQTFIRARTDAVAQSFAARSIQTSREHQLKLDDSDVSGGQQIVQSSMSPHPGANEDE
jgi:hypothetical protein